MAHSTELFSIEADPFFVEDLRQMARANNYRHWQFNMVAPFLTGQVLEVGGGIGNFTPQIASVADSVTSIEPNEYCFKQLQEKVGALKNVTAHRVTVESLGTVVPAGKKFDAVVMMNVLEHIKDDHAVLAELKKHLTPTGKMVILVPAGQWASGHMDDRLGHYRRYGKAYSRKLFTGLGLDVIFMRYYNFIGIWAWWWNAKFAKRENQSDSQIKLFDKWFVPVISRVENLVPPPVGQSILIVGRPAK